MNQSETDTIISLISSSSGGSVSVIRISGADVTAIAEKHFRGSQNGSLEGGRFYYGRIVDQKERQVDEVVLLYFKEPHSYTGEHVIEISCHANLFIVSDILETFQDSGCRLAEPGEFTKRAFLNGKMDLVQAEAVADLIMSKSRAGVQNSLMQVEGKLSERLKKLKQTLLDSASLIELDLDFSEEDPDIIRPDDIRERLNNLIFELENLIKSYRYGHILSTGIEVLIAGKPNVGKSRLMNTFLEKDRVIVSEIPGTTRDMIHEDTIVELCSHVIAPLSSLVTVVRLSDCCEVVD
jgi:tRNA modification GTPase